MNTTFVDNLVLGQSGNFGLIGYLNPHRYLTTMFISLGYPGMIVVCIGLIITVPLLEQRIQSKIKCFFYVLLCGFMSVAVSVITYFNTESFIYGFYGAVSGAIGMVVGGYKTNTMARVVMGCLWAMLTLMTYFGGGMDYIGTTAGFVTGYMIGRGKLLKKGGKETIVQSDC
jgi:membrane associated rhomboid family serine protease